MCFLGTLAKSDERLPTFLLGIAELCLARASERPDKKHFLLLLLLLHFARGGKGKKVGMLRLPTAAVRQRRRSETKFFLLPLLAHLLHNVFPHFLGLPPSPHSSSSLMAAQDFAFANFWRKL